MTLTEALESAYRERPDYLATQERVRAAELSLQAVKSERLPAVSVNADYGAIGLQVSSALATFNITAAVKMPIFDGGRIDGLAIRAEADLKQRRAEADDKRAEVYYDVRMAFLDLEATNEELQTATRSRELAGQQLTQTRDRFAAGVASNVEVHVTPIASRVGGTVQAAAVADNQSVTAGAVLVQIDPRDFQLAVEKAR